MKLNWGKKIVFVFAAFVLLILTLVVKSSQQRIDLVATDYYQKELEVEDKINQSKRAMELNKKVQMEFTSTHLNIRFPEPEMAANTSGTITFQRPSNKALDRDFPIVLNEEGVQQIARNAFEKGHYRVLIQWKTKSVTYYTEKVLFIP
jgi:hypothetical protein